MRLAGDTTGQHGREDQHGNGPPLCCALVLRVAASQSLRELPQAIAFLAIRLVPSVTILVATGEHGHLRVGADVVKPCRMRRPPVVRGHQHDAVAIGEVEQRRSSGSARTCARRREQYDG